MSPGFGSALSWSASGPAALVIVVVSVGLVIWQWSRMTGRGSRIRRLAWLVTIAALALLALGPMRPEVAANGDVVLLTEGVTDRLVETAASGDGRPSFALPNTSGVGGRDARPIPDLGWLLRTRAPSRIEILGHGLEPWDADRLERVEGTNVAFTPAAAPTGIVDVHWRRSLRLGQALTVRGTVRGLGTGAGTLDLLDPAGVASTVEVAADGSFAVAAVPRIAGRLRYRLRFTPAPKDGGTEAIGTEAVSESIVDVSVAPPKLPKVLWLASAPSFETRYLGTWLADQGGALGVRTAISRDRYRFARFNFDRENLPDDDLARLDSRLLDRFDVAVADARFLGGLSRRATQTLTAAVARGLGLLVLPDSSAESVFGWRLEAATLDLRPDDDLDDDSIQVRIDWGAEGVSAPIAIPSWRLMDDDRARPLASDAFGRVLAASRPLGEGQVGISLLDRSYRFVLEGEADDHRRWWSRLLSGLARPESAPEIMPPSTPILVDRPLTVDVILPRDANPDLEGELPARWVAPDGQARDLAWRQDLLDPMRFEATLWPDTIGWHRIEVAGAALDIDVQSADAWSDWQRGRRREATRRLASREVVNVELPSRQGASKPALRLPLFLLALLGAAILWTIERREGHVRVFQKTVVSRS